MSGWRSRPEAGEAGPASDQVRVAVVGATGAVGRVMLETLHARSFPASEVVPFASARSAGDELQTPFGPLTVRPLTDDGVAGFDIALFSAGSGPSREWAPRFAAGGAVVVDNSSCWRMDPQVPLVVAEVNPEAIDAHKGIVANPNCTTMVMVVALKPLHDEAQIERLVLSSYQAVSGTGVKAVQELEAQARAVLAGEAPPAPAVYPHRIAFNVLPQVESFSGGDDYTTEERKVMAETRKILGEPELRVTATCARVPVMTGHSESLNLQTVHDLPPERAREVLAAAPGVTVVDDPASGGYPLAIDAAGRDEVLVGRIRRDPSNERTLNLWVVGDNLRKGAALNAVQLAELLHERGLVGTSARA
ncbi:MAG TPA: aspartate-semialdehyde dehydrogenase [Solirubrobacteraceae bacterium]|jgi:aspartate-semialdehyde dehydrogenase|nr:aspartate-semialdehyde dehydrogenase [Solirubrobacteraceae bacterium]